MEEWLEEVNRLVAENPGIPVRIVSYPKSYQIERRWYDMSAEVRVNKIVTGLRGEVFFYDRYRCNMNRVLASCIPFKALRTLTAEEKIAAYDALDWKDTIVVVCN